MELQVKENGMALGGALLERPETTTPDAEVSSKPVRRRFSAKYKQRILVEVDRCNQKKAVGALLRREGLYSSYLGQWRRQREAGELEALSPKKRGVKAAQLNPLKERNQELERELKRVQKKLKHAELVIEVQKKISEMLEIPLSPLENEEKSE